MRRRFGYEELGLGIFIGLTVGSVLGMLFAPYEGSKSRLKLAEYINDTRESMVEIWPDMQNKADQVFLKAQGILGLQKKTIRKRLDDLKNEIKNFEFNQVG